MRGFLDLVELKRMIEEIELLLNELDLIFKLKILGLGSGLGLIEFLFLLVLFSLCFFQIFFQFIKFLISFGQELLVIFFHTPDHFFVSFLLFRGFNFCGELSLELFFLLFQLFVFALNYGLDLLQF